MNLNILISLLLTFVCIVACDKEDVNTENDYLVFGHFYGECGGERCVEIYKLTNESLVEDVADIYPSSEDFYEGDFATLLPDSIREEVKDLWDHFPESLLNETATVIGQPDAGDWGGIYFEIKRGNTHRFWLLDQHNGNMPQEYNVFVDRINERITIIDQ